MSALIISTCEISIGSRDVIERLERQVDQHRADLAHLEATMRLFDPKSRPEHSNEHHRQRNDCFVQRMSSAHP